MTTEEQERFRVDLLAWYAQNKRDLPWRRSRDPYAIWISEIMLQQTRVVAAIPYFERFLNRFPDFRSLADAAEADLLSHWAGLGYYYRARNLQKAAKLMLSAGSFPSNYETIAELPGVGEYTAAAVSSIAFNLPYAVVDGNVYRVLSRVFDDSTNIAGGVPARKHFTRLANMLLDRTNPGTFNQAVMELGATVCLPKKPQCLLCPVGSLCLANARGTQDQRPIKIKAKISKEELRRVFIVRNADSLLLWQRPPSARLMPGFWELPEQAQLPDANLETKLGTFRHGITVHNYTFEVWSASLAQESIAASACAWVRDGELERLPVSTIARKALEVEQRAAVRSKAAAI